MSKTKIHIYIIVLTFTRFHNKCLIRKQVNYGFIFSFTVLLAAALVLVPAGSSVFSEDSFGPLYIRVFPSSYGWHVTRRAYCRMLCGLFFTGRVLLSHPGCRPQPPGSLSPLGLKACAATPDVCFTDPAETSIQHWPLNKAAAPGHELISNESVCHYMAKYFLARFLAYKR